MSVPRSTTLTRIQLAAKLAVKPRTVTAWLEEGLPVAKRGHAGRPSRYCEADVLAWIAARDAAGNGTAAKPGGNFAESRSRKELAQAVESELRVAIKLGRLLPVETVDETWSRQVAAIRSKLLALPMALSDRLHRAATLSGADGVEALLQTAVYDVLRELSGEAKTERAPRAKSRRKRTKKATRKPRAQA